jgi:hypothetical protein
VVLIQAGMTRFHGSVVQMKKATNCVHLVDAYLALTGEAVSSGVRRADARVIRKAGAL